MNNNINILIVSKNKNSSHVPIPRMVMFAIASRGIRIGRVSAIHNHGSRVMSSAVHLIATIVCPPSSCMSCCKGPALSLRRQQRLE